MDAAARPEWIPSDLLMVARSFVYHLRDLGLDVGTTERLRLVVDTNQVLADVRYLAKRGSRDLRTAMEEAADSGAVILYAPTQLQDEVDRKIVEISKKQNIPLAHLQEVWRQYQDILCFVPLKDSELRAPSALDARDPTDKPFVAVYRRVGAHALLTKDKDYSGLNVVRAPPMEAMRAARAFAREAAVQNVLSALGSGGLLVSFELLSRATPRLRKLPSQVRALTPLIAVGSAGAAFWLVCSPAARQKLVEALRRVGHEAQRTVEALVQLVRQHHQAKEAAAEFWHVLATFVEGHSGTYEQAVAALLAAAAEPLTVAQIAYAVRDFGVDSPVDTARVERVLESDSSYLHIAGKWVLRGREVAELSPPDPSGDEDGEGRLEHRRRLHSFRIPYSFGDLFLPLDEAQ